MSDKKGVLKSLRDEFNRWEALLASMSEAQITAPRQPSGWSVKDVIAHLRAWQQVSIARVEAALHDALPAMPDWTAGKYPDDEGHLEQFNATIHAASRDTTWPRVHQLWRDGFLRFLALSEAVPEHDMLAVDRYSWIEG